MDRQTTEFHADWVAAERSFGHSTLIMHTSSSKVHITYCLLSSKARTHKCECYDSFWDLTQNDCPIYF